MRTILFLLLTALVFGQDSVYFCWDLSEEAPDHDEAYAIVIAGDGNILMTGNGVIVGDTTGTIWVKKINPNGGVFWNRAYSTGQQYSKSIIQTSEGGYAIIGYGGDNLWLMKLDQFGIEEWHFVFDSGKSEYGRSVQQTDDGGFILGGYAEYPGVFLMVKVDASGSLEWSQSYGRDSVHFRAWSIICSLDNSYILAGYGANYTPDYDFFGYLIKVDLSGEIIWDLELRGPNNESARIYNIDLTQDNEITFVGNIIDNNFPSRRSGWIGRVSASGELLQEGSTNFASEYYRDAKVLEGGNVFVGGHLGARAYGKLLTYDFQLIWDYQSTGLSNENIWSVECDNLGSYYLVGSRAGAGWDALTIKLSDITYEETVVINEIMVNPNAALDSNGEWFELYNTTNRRIEMQGWSFQDNGQDIFVIGNSISIDPQEVLTLGINSTIWNNGGAEISIEYSNFFLNNQNDAIILYDSTGALIDSVVWSSSYPIPYGDGISAALINSSFDNNQPSSWEASTLTFGDGDYGTPGWPNFYPVLELISEEISFSNTMIGLVDTTSLFLTNISNDTLFMQDVISSDESFSAPVFDQFVLPNDTLDIFVYFSPQQMGPTISNLHLISNSLDPNESIAILSGVGIEPNSDINTIIDTVIFPITNNGEQVIRYPEVYNVGILPLDIYDCEIIDSENNFTIGDYSTQLEYGESTAIMIILEIDENTQEETPTLVVYSNDPDEPTYSLAIEVKSTVKINEQEPHLPREYKLFQNYPNPFNPITSIAYSLPKQSNVKLTVFDIQGREVMRFYNADKPPGNYHVLWDGLDQAGNSVSTGMYFCRLDAGSYSKTIKMIYLK